MEFVDGTVIVPWDDNDDADCCLFLVSQPLAGRHDARALFPECLAAMAKRTIDNVAIVVAIPHLSPSDLAALANAVTGSATTSESWETKTC